MKRILLFFAAALSAAISLNAQNPVARPEATVVCGNARFTVLTDRLVRMEWAADGKFEDRASFAIVNRDLPVPAFKAVPEGNGITVKTGRLTLAYKGGRFAPENLSVAFKLNGKSVTWHPGDAPTGNLKGTTRTLDSRMATLRRKLGPDGSYIETQRGLGYRFNAPPETAKKSRQAFPVLPLVFAPFRVRV